MAADAARLLSDTTLGGARWASARGSRRVARYRTDIVILQYIEFYDTCFDRHVR